MLALYTKTKAYLIIAAVVLVSTLVMWLPFLLRTDQWMSIPIDRSNVRHIFRHYDGLLYLLAAKTFYNTEALGKIVIDTPLDVRYYAAHLPLYPMTLVVLAPVFGFLKSLVVSTVGFTILLGWLFYYIVSRLKLTSHPLMLTAVLMFLPRFAVVRSVGAPESMFLFFILLSLFMFERKQYAYAGLAGALAAMTKSPGLLLLPAFGLVIAERYIRERKFDPTVLWVGLVPLGFLAVCMIYYVQMGDFFAYFNSGDNIHLTHPLSAFNYSKRWVGTAWLEEIVFYIAMYTVTVITLARSQLRSFFYFGLVFLTAVLFVEHRDIARYSLPLWPLACIAFEKFFTDKRIKYAAFIIIPAVTVYGWNFMTQNVMPVSNWDPFI